VATKEVAVKKRAQIDKATQTMLLAVGLASIVLGCAAVLSVWCIKWIIFNTKVTGEKGKVIEDFKTIQDNVKELADNIDALSENENLEVIARVRGSQCKTIEGDLVDMRGNVELTRVCSALRVIPDALPSVSVGGEPNNEAAYASLNKLFLETRDKDGEMVQPELIAPGGGGGGNLALDPSLGTVPAALLIENTATTTRAVLDTIERSIRNYDILTVRIVWRNSGGGKVDDEDEEVRIELRGNAVAYYANAMEAMLKAKVIYADDSKNTMTGGTGR
jgi:hypothetical protein